LWADNRSQVINSFSVFLAMHIGQRQSSKNKTPLCTTGQLFLAFHCPDKTGSMEQIKRQKKSDQNSEKTCKKSSEEKSKEAPKIKSEEKSEKEVVLCI